AGEAPLLDGGGEQAQRVLGRAGARRRGERALEPPALGLVHELGGLRALARWRPELGPPAGLRALADPALQRLHLATSLDARLLLLGAELLVALAPAHRLREEIVGRARVVGAVRGAPGLRRRRRGRARPRGRAAAGEEERAEQPHGRRV